MNKCLPRPRFLSWLMSVLCWNFRTLYGVGARNRVGLGLSYRPARAQILELLRSPGTDPKKSIPPAYVAWQGWYDNLFLLGSYSS
jgi:hypothetical protein